MRTKRTIVIEKEIITYICDFCTYSTEDNRGCCGFAPIMRCSLCNKDTCSKHRHVYSEDPSSDYYDAIVCDDCNVLFKEAWEWAEKHAERYDNIYYDIAASRFNLLKTEKK